jgi:hypothetical protein
MVALLIRRPPYLAIAQSVVAVALAVLAGACDKVPLTAPTGSVIRLTATATVVPVNGTADITAYVIESAGTPVQNGTLVVFSTNLGSFDPVEARTHNGSVTVRYYAGGASGTATIRASSGGITSGASSSTTTTTSELQIKVGAAAAARVVLNASPGTVPAGGGTITLTATVMDENGNRLAGVPVTFASTAGTLLNGTVLTDSNGEARTTLTTAQQAQVSVTAGGQTAQLTVSVSPPINVSISVASGTTPIAGQPVAFSVTASAGSGGAPLSSVVVAWGDGEEQSLGTPSSGAITVNHVYRNTGTYTATVTATDTAGQRATASTSVIVTSAVRPLVSLTVPTSVAANTIFTAQVSISQNPNNLTVQSTEFNFGDSVVRRVNGLQTTHVYTSAGNYNIRATVTFSDGQQATAEAGIRVTLSATTTTTTIAP